MCRPSYAASWTRKQSPWPWLYIRRGGYFGGYFRAMIVLRSDFAMQHRERLGVVGRAEVRRPERGRLWVHDPSSLAL